MIGSRLNLLSLYLSTSISTISLSKSWHRPSKSPNCSIEPIDLQRNAHRNTSHSKYSFQSFATATHQASRCGGKTRTKTKVKPHQRRRRKLAPHSASMTSRIWNSLPSVMLCGISPHIPPLPLYASANQNRYIRAFEVGRPSDSSKYDLALKIRTLKNGPVVRNRLRLPHPVKTNLKIAVICPSPSPVATAALAAGATLCGEENLFEIILKGSGALPFDRLLCHTDSLQKLNKAGLGRILGPKGLMPTVKFNTVIKDVTGAVKGMVAASEYREKLGVIRLAIGQLGFTPEEMQRNIRHFMEGVKRDFAALSDTVTKEIHEVVSFFSHPNR